ncbi:MAG: hypothetical protein ACERLG_08050, partial [Sedimentibacter sp.]
MKKALFRTTVSIAIISVVVLTSKAYGDTYNASNFSELENVLFEQMLKYDENFDIKYTGSWDNIEETLQNVVDKDSYLNSNIKSV